MAAHRLACPAPAPPPVRPSLNDQPSRFMLLEREVEQEYRPQMLARLQHQVDAVAGQAHATAPPCPHCAGPMGYHDTRPVSWLALWGCLHASAARYRCGRCKQESRPLLDLLGVEPGCICGSLARLLALLAVVAPYELAARLAGLLLGVKISAMGVWRVAHRLGQAAANYSDELSRYHADSRSQGTPVENAPPVVVLAVDGCVLGMQVRKHRRSRVGKQALPAFTTLGKRAVPGGQNGRTLTASGASGNVAGTPFGGAAIPGHLPRGRRRDIPAPVWTIAGVGLGRGRHG